MDEPSSHAKVCTGGVCPFLMVRACKVLMLMSGGRRCMWGSLYLDEHGEPDYNLKRGVSLILSPRRVEALRRQLFMLAIDNDTKLLLRATRRVRGY